MTLSIARNKATSQTKLLPKRLPAKRKQLSQLSPNLSYFRLNVLLPVSARPLSKVPLIR